MGHEVSTIALYYSKEPFCLYGKIRRKLYCKYGIDVRISKKGIQCAKVEKYQKKRNDNFLQFRSEKIHTDTRWIEKNNFRNLDSEYDLFIVCLLYTSKMLKFVWFKDSYYLKMKSHINSP